MENQQPNQNPLANLSVTELKSLAYDNLTQVQTSQSNLQILTQEINKRSQPPAQPQTESVAI